jgi:hypothetical protein
MLFRYIKTPDSVNLNSKDAANLGESEPTSAVANPLLVEDHLDLFAGSSMIMCGAFPPARTSDLLPL